jgi:hypothetical protein
VEARVGVTAQDVAHYVDLSDIPANELLVYCGELVCFEEMLAADTANGATITLADTVMGEHEPTAYFNWFDTIFGKGFPLIHTGVSERTDRFDPTRTTMTELSRITQLKKQPRFALTNSKILAFEVPDLGTIPVEEFHKLTMTIRKAVYLGATITFQTTTSN